MKIDKDYVLKLERRVEELEEELMTISENSNGLNDYSVYFILHDSQTGFEDCIEHSEVFKNFDSAFDFAKKYMKRKRKRKHLENIEIVQNKKFDPDIKGGGKFWSVGNNGTIIRQGDESLVDTQQMV